MELRQLVKDIQHRKLSWVDKLALSTLGFILLYLGYTVTDALAFGWQ